MYEFTDKKIREKFKKTKYGKQVNKYLYISLGCLLIVILAIIICAILKTPIKDIAALLSLPLFISIVFMCYFDGKRDGAIEQFKRK